jgi:hypothetical protein
MPGEESDDETKSDKKGSEGSRAGGAERHYCSFIFKDGGGVTP